MATHFVFKNLFKSGYSKLNTLLGCHYADSFLSSDFSFL